LAGSVDMAERSAHEQTKAQTFPQVVRKVASGVDVMRIAEAGPL